MSDITIRALEPGDAAAISDIFDQPRAVWGTMQLPFVSRADRAQRLGAIGPGHTRLVAEIDGRVVGTAGLHPFDSPRRAHAASLGMAVHDAFAGRGAGTALMQALMDQADRWLNYRRVELGVYADNARAIALYERFGFVREGVATAYAFRNGAFADVLMMGRVRM